MDRRRQALLDKRTTYVPTRPETSEAIYRELERLRKAGRLPRIAPLTLEQLGFREA